MRRGFGVVVVLWVGSVICVSGVEADVANSRSGGELFSKILEAKSMLEGERVDLEKGVVSVRRVRISRRRFRNVGIVGITGRQVALAIFSVQGQLHIVRGLKRNNNGFELLTPGYSVLLKRENGINSEFQCLDPVGGRVLAIKYPVLNEHGRFGGHSTVIEAIYTPYSAEIEGAEMVQRGLVVQNGIIREAYKRLKGRGVRSRAFDDALVAEVIPPEVIRVLLINEHIDPWEFRSSGQAESLARRVLTVIGANGDKAYAYSISSAGARGLVQMIPSTYSLLLRKYPESGLEPSFSSGMTDCINAVVAQILLCDSDWGVLRSRFEITAEQVGPYLAAAYNGGVSRVLSLISSEQSEWLISPDLNRRPVVEVKRRVAIVGRLRRGRVRKKYAVKTYVVPIFRSETSKYISQYHWIKSYLDSCEVRTEGDVRNIK